MATATTVPLEVYLRSSYEPDAEYVDGVIEERPVGELDHAAWQEALLAYFRQHRDWNVKAYPELRVQVGRTRFRVPDVTVLDQNAPKEQIVTVPPLMVFEVLSPEDIMRRVLVKLADYAQMGIPGIFLIDPIDHKYFIYMDGSLEYIGGPVQVAGRQIDFDEIAKLLA
jgi:Uma2 family endonuclease